MQIVIIYLMNPKDLVSLFYEAGTLRTTARSHRQTLLTHDLSDNIAAHSFRTAIIGWFLADLEKADHYQVTLMCLFHDFTETRCGDQNWIHKKYTHIEEEQILQDQFQKTVPAIFHILVEYHHRQTLEAKLAKDADLLDQILLLREYAWQGNEEAKLWLKGNEQQKRLFSKSAKRLAREALIQPPSLWWNHLWTAART